MEHNTAITAHALSIGYRTDRKVHTVHSGLSFSLRQGELTCLLGANGAGKSTLLRTLSASQPALGGELTVMGKPLSEYTERERSRTIGVVLTDKTFAGGLTVYELAGLGRQPHTGFFGRLRKEDKRIIDEALENVGISHKKHSYVAELSDGERQKAMIAKALVQECPLILLDEPTAFLDVVSRIEIMNLLHRLAAEQGKAILLSTHDIEQALTLADRLWLLSAEHGMLCGETEDMVLAGHMDSLFDNKGICFDYDSGSYNPTVCGGQDISVVCEDKTLMHWTLNALRRHGFNVLPANDEHCGIRIEVTSRNGLRLTRGGQVMDCTSFEALIQQIEL